jgi:ribosome maturation factor RimP
MGREKELYEEVRTITEPIGLVIVDLAIKERREGTNIYLVIHKDTGVTIQDCERVSKFLNDRLSVLGNVWGRKDYSLQVSSPGLYREFKNKREYNIFRSRQVKIILKKPYEDISKNPVLEGKLVNMENDIVSLEMADKTVEVPLQRISTTKLNG